MSKSNKYVVNFLKKVCVSDNCVLPVLKASNSCTYVETMSNKADTLHYYLDKTYPEVLSEKFFEFSKERIKKLRLSIADLVADITEEEFYGNSSSLFIHNWTGERGVKAKFRFLVVAAKFRNQLLPFYAAILPVGYFKADYLGEAIEWFSTLNIKIRKVVLDRGFYSGDVINTLKLKKINYLIFVPKKKIYQYMLESVEKGAVIEHSIEYTKDKSNCYAKTNLVLAKDICGYNWIFATSLFFQNIGKYVRLYKQRWNIETMFRVHDEARIKSKSIKPIIRLFYFIISMLIMLLWSLYHKTSLTFKLFIIRLYETIFYRVLGINYSFSV